MSMKRTRNTKHSYDRSSERFGLSKSNTKLMIKNALFYGISPDKLEDEELKNKLLHKQACNRKRIKIYKNKVFVFCKTSTKCITIYPLEKGQTDEKED